MAHSPVSVIATLRARTLPRSCSANSKKRLDLRSEPWRDETVASSVGHMRNSVDFHVLSRCHPVVYTYALLDITNDIIYYIGMGPNGERP
jgi:hypothetical protein